MTRTSLLAAAAALAVSGALSAPAFAHHSTAMFDMEHTVSLTGVVKDFQWTQPHTWIDFEVPNGAGGVEPYGVEGMSPSYLGRNGWSKRTLNPGDKVTLAIHPLKDGRKGGFDASVTWPDGKTMYNLPQRGGAAAAQSAK
ncbi:MAG TPA: DUF6152 family protein [Caulobacteraceae bacterium]